MTITSAAAPLGQIIVGSLLDINIDTYIIILVIALIILVAGIINHILYLPNSKEQADII